jgi:hypothetical protein
LVTSAGFSPCNKPVAVEPHQDVDVSVRRVEHSFTIVTASRDGTCKIPVHIGAQNTFHIAAADVTELVINVRDHSSSWCVSSPPWVDVPASCCTEKSDIEPVIAAMKLFPILNIKLSVVVPDVGHPG